MISSKCDTLKEFRILQLPCIYSRRKHARKKKPKYASEIDSRIHDEDEDSISRENVLKRDHNNMTKRQSNRSGMEYIQKHIKRKSLLEKPSKRQQKEGLSDNGKIFLRYVMHLNG